MFFKEKKFYFTFIKTAKIVDICYEGLWMFFG